MKININCSYCDKEFLKEKGEYDRQLLNNSEAKFYCSKKCIKDDRTLPLVIKTCKECGGEFNITQKTDRRYNSLFCGRACSNRYMGRNLSMEERKRRAKKISKGVKRYIKNNPDKFYEACDRAFKTIQSKGYFCSKGEKEMFNTLKENSELLIQTGGAFKIAEDGTRKQFDAFCKETKTIIEYDGICHFKAIYGEEDFKKLIRKDKLLKIWCKENEWSLIRIREEVYQKDKTYWNEKLLNHIENNDSEYFEYY